MTFEQERVIDAARYVAIFDWGCAGITEDYHNRRIGAMEHMRDAIAKLIESMIPH